jgi:hypothetical protein
MKTKIKIHGTYPFDAFGKWTTVKRNLPLHEVAGLLGIEVSKEDLEKHDGGRKYLDGVYLWLNKGFVLLKDMPEEAGVGEDGYLGVACMEMLGGSPSVKDIQVGDQAIYLHDGSYSLIKRVEE